MTIRTARRDELDAIRALLAAAKLPTQDLDTANIRWFVDARDGELAGFGGVQIFGDAGLLRSLFVSAARRGAGIGAALVGEIDRWSRAQGLRELVLLTETAEGFFAGRGYARVTRDAVPAQLQASAEFRTLCPASAVCMRKALAPIKRVLFVCVENSNRSQMAEAFAHMIGGDAVYACSAGSRPSGRINPRAVQFMRELGYDMTQQHSKALADVDGEYDAVVTMGCGDSCPWVPARRRIDWELPDPKDLPDDAYRAVRDDIAQRVRGLLEEL